MPARTPQPPGGKPWMATPMADGSPHFLAIRVQDTDGPGLHSARAYDRLAVPSVRQAMARW